MTLTILDVEQREPEWYAARCGKITASAVGRLLTPTLKVADNDTARGLTATLAAERITGWTEETGMTPDMWRGVEHEPIARDTYAEHWAHPEHAPVTTVGFMVREEEGWSLGYSPDGLVGDNGLIEIKCPRPKGHLNTILDDAVPERYMAQCQAALFVSGRKWIDYVSFVGGMPLFVKRVKPSPLWFEAITAAVINFEQRVTEIVAAYTHATTDMPATKRVDLEIVI